MTKSASHTTGQVNRMLLNQPLGVGLGGGPAMRGGVTSSSNTTSYGPFFPRGPLAPQFPQLKIGKIKPPSVGQAAAFNRQKNSGEPTPQSGGAASPTSFFPNIEAEKQRLKDRGYTLTGFEKLEGGGYKVTGKSSKPLPMAGRQIKTTPNGARVWWSPYAGTRGYESYTNPEVI
jgi:hypothetical protein